MCVSMIFRVLIRSRPSSFQTLASNIVWSDPAAICATCVGEGSISGDKRNELSPRPSWPELVRPVPHACVQAVTMSSRTILNKNILRPHALLYTGIIDGAHAGRTRPSSSKNIVYPDPTAICTRRVGEGSISGDKRSDSSPRPS